MQPVSFPLPDSIPAELREMLKNELQPDETLLWAAQPNPIRHLYHRIPFMMTGMILFLLALGAVITTVLAIVSNPFDVTAFGDWLHLLRVLAEATVLSLLIILGAALSALPLHAYNAAKIMVYAITDRRAFCIEQEVPLAKQMPTRIHRLLCKEQHDGSGNLYVDVPQEGEPIFAKINRKFVLREMIGIHEVRRAEHLLRKIMANTVHEDNEPLLLKDF